jgi:hypothetical protein
MITCWLTPTKQAPTEGRQKAAFSLNPDIRQNRSKAQKDCQRQPGGQAEQLNLQDF